MEIEKQIRGEQVEMRVRGRMDGYWADHLGSALDEVIRQGSHQISLDLSGVPYMSSAGIRVLVKCYKQLRTIRGTFLISKVSDQVQRIIVLSGLSETLLPEIPETPAAPRERGSAVKSMSRASERVEKASGSFDVFTLDPVAKLKCRSIGNPQLLRGGRYQKQDCAARAFAENSFAVGLGALGDTYEDCEARFGEFLAASGALAYLPTDGTNAADYFVPAGEFVHAAQVCYAAEFSGDFAKLARFETKQDQRPLSLTRLVEASWDLAASKRIGFVMLAETSGLTGAALRRPPTQSGPLEDPFAFPEVRKWLTFTSEPTFVRSLALVVGIASEGDPGDLGPILRPFGSNRKYQGHFHAAAFTYRPMQKGEIHLSPTVRSLFSSQTLQGVLHLLCDDRAIYGVGESEFLRGAIWVGPISEVLIEGA